MDVCQFSMYLLVVNLIAYKITTCFLVCLPIFLVRVTSNKNNLKCFLLLLYPQSLKWKPKQLLIIYPLVEINEVYHQQFHTTTQCTWAMEIPFTACFAVNVFFILCSVHVIIPIISLICQEIHKSYKQRVFVSTLCFLCRR